MRTSKKYTYFFNSVADSNVSQKEFYDRNVRDIVSAVIEGKNGAVVAYGPSRTGKTYTLVGPDLTEGTDEFVTEETAGVAQRAFE